MCHTYSISKFESTVSHISDGLPIVKCRHKTSISIDDKVRVLSPLPDFRHHMLVDSPLLSQNLCCLTQLYIFQSGIVCESLH